MKHLMIDLETLGTRPNCPMLTLGAVFFDPQTGELGDELYIGVDLQSCLDAGREPSGDTIQWWFKQGKEAQEALFDKNKPTFTLDGALKEFREFCTKCKLTTGPVAWSNGATFDIAILENCFQANGEDPPWKYWNVLDVRTIKALASPVVKASDIPFEGVKHNALADAKHQARWVSLMWRTIKSGLKKCDAI